MPELFDVLIVGAGPAGMSAAIRAAALGVRAGVIDEQAAPGGQIWRDVERRSSLGQAADLGSDYVEGAEMVADFRAAGVEYIPETTVWHVEPGFRVFTRRADEVRILTARTLVIATGAIERPAPFPGWTLPGVLTVGAAQILLKTAGQLPESPVWIAGNGPLLLLYVNQLLDAGGKVAGILSTALSEGPQATLPHLAGALKDWGGLLKGIRWSARIRAHGIVRRVTEIEARGANKLESVGYRTSAGEQGTVQTPLLLVHEGVVPDTQLTQALGCRHQWQDAQQCFVPVLDEWGQTTLPGVFVAGDGGGIGGAKAADAAGEIVAFGVMQALGRMSTETAQRACAESRERHRRSLAIRPLLDTLYRPRSQCCAPADETIVCRCEAVTAGAIRAAIRAGASDPNDVKAQTRCGMGPCLGRQCGAITAQLLSQSTGRAIEEIGLFRARPPLRPITLGQLASLATSQS